jgi:hypothetical protein
MATAFHPRGRAFHPVLFASNSLCSKNAGVHPMVCALLLQCALFFGSGCGKAAPEPVYSGQPQPGSIHSLNDGEGGFRVAKVIAASDEVVFVHLFSERWAKRPSRTEIERLTRPAPTAFAPETFSGMQPVHLKDGAVAPEETSAFEEWTRSGADVL